MTNPFRPILAVVMFGPFLVSLWFLRHALRHRQRERLRWQVPGLVANLGLGVGFALLALVESGVWAWVGLSLVLIASVAGGWLTWAEHKAGNAADSKSDPAA